MEGRSPINRSFKKSLASSIPLTTSNPLKTSSSTSSTLPPSPLQTRTSSVRFKRTKTSCTRQFHLGRGYPLGAANSINPSRNSQEERVSILKHALVQKGVISPSHYDLDPSRSTQPASTTTNPEPNPPTTGNNDGLYL